MGRTGNAISLGQVPKKSPVKTCKREPEGKASSEEPRAPGGLEVLRFSITEASIERSGTLARCLTDGARRRNRAQWARPPAGGVTSTSLGRGPSSSLRRVASDRETGAGVTDDNAVAFLKVGGVYDFTGRILIAWCFANRAMHHRAARRGVWRGSISRECRSVSAHCSRGYFCFPTCQWPGQNCAAQHQWLGERALLRRVCRKSARSAPSGGSSPINLLPAGG